MFGNRGIEDVLVALDQVFSGIFKRSPDVHRRNSDARDVTRGEERSAS